MNRWQRYFVDQGGSKEVVEELSVLILLVENQKTEFQNEHELT